MPKLGKEEPNYEVERLAIWLFEKFPLAGYHTLSKFGRLKPYQKDMMMAHAEKLRQFLFEIKEREK